VRKLQHRLVLVFGSFIVCLCVVGKNRCPEADRLGECKIAELNGLSLQIKALTRAASGQQSAIVDDVRYDLYPVAT